MRNLIIIASIMYAVSAEDENDRLKVQDIADEATKDLPYRMRIETRGNTSRFVFGDEVFDRNNRDALKAYNTSKAMVNVFDALVEAGVPRDQMQFSTMRRDGNGYRPSSTIFLNPPGSQAGTAPVDTTEKLVEEYFAAGGNLEAYQNMAGLGLPDAAVRGWLRAQAKTPTKVEAKVKTTEIQADEV